MNLYFMNGLKKVPITVERLLHSIPAEKYDVRTAPNRFNVREAIAHLADWEPIWMERFRLCMETPGSRIVVYDEERLAVERKYNERDPLEEAKRFIEGRDALIAYLQTFDTADWDKTLDHPERGLLTLGNFGCMILGHDIYHIEHFTEYLQPA